MEYSHKLVGDESLRTSIKHAIEITIKTKYVDEWVHVGLQLVPNVVELLLIQLRLERILNKILHGEGCWY